MALNSGALSIHGAQVVKFTAGAKAELAGLMRVGKVTTATSVTEFASTDLIGQGDDAFDGWYVSVLQADNAAPEGEIKPMSDYVSNTGTITHTAFTAQLAVGDWVVLLRPEIAMLGTVATAAASGAVTETDVLMAYVKQLINYFYLADADLSDVLDDSPFAHIFAKDGDVSAFDDNLHSLEALYDKMVALQGGSETIESLDDELDAMIDMAKTPDTRTISTIGTEETISAFTTTNANPMYIAGVWLGMENLAAGDKVVWAVHVDWDDSSIADQMTSDHAWTFGGVQTPSWVYKPLGIWITYEIVVKVNQFDGTERAFYSVLDIGQRGS